MEGSWKELRLAEAGHPGDRAVEAELEGGAPLRDESSEGQREGNPPGGGGVGSGLFEIPEATTTGRRCIHCGVNIVIDRVFRCTWCRMGPQCRNCNGLHETGQGFVVPCEQRPLDVRKFAEGSPGRASDRAKEEIEEVSTVNSFEMLDSASAKTGEYLR